VWLWEYNMKKIRICEGISCRLNGSEKKMREYEHKFNLKAGEQNDKIDLDFCGCTGHCCNAVNVRKDDKVFSVYENGREVERTKEKNNLILKDNFLGDI